MTKLEIKNWPKKVLTWGTGDNMGDIQARIQN